MLEREPKIKKMKPEEKEPPKKPEAWLRLEKSGDKAIQEMIRKGILSLEKISGEEIEKDKKEGKDVTLIIHQKENGAIKEKIINYTSESKDDEYAEYTEKLVYEFKNGATIHFENLLPDKWKMKQSPAADPKEGAIVFEKSKVIGYGRSFEKKFAFFDLLHEIGHVLHLEKLKSENQEEYKKISLAAGEMDDFDRLSKNRQRELLYTIAAEERNAWAIALNIARVLKNCGLDFEPENMALENLKQRITGSLASYQRNVKKDIFLRGTKFSEKEIKVMAEKIIDEMAADLSELKTKRESDRQKISEESFRKMKKK